MAEKRTAAALAVMVALGLPFTQGNEGLRLTPYHDTTGTLTICYGNTQGITKIQKETPESCSVMLKVQLTAFGWAVSALVQTDMTTNRWIALTDFAYNVGIYAFAKSTLLKRINRNDPAACDALRKWIYSKGKKLPGLVKRREDERKLCLS